MINDKNIKEGDILTDLQVVKNFLFLIKLLNSNMESLSKSHEVAKRKAFWMKITIVGISSTITVILGLKINNFGPSLALILSGILTVLTTMDQFLNLTTRDKKIAIRVGLVTRLLLDVQFYLESNQNPTAEKLEEFKNRYDSFLDNIMDSVKVKETELQNGDTKQEIQE